MAINIRALVNSAYRAPGIIGDYDSVEGNDASDAISTLNEILAQLNSEQLFPFQMTTADYSVPGNVREVTIGPSGADITATRPEFINSVCYSSSVSTNPYKITQVPYVDIIANRLATGSGAPFAFAYNPELPSGRILFDRYLQSGSVITVIYVKEIPEVTIDTLLDVPPNYQAVIKFALARQVAVTKQMPADTVERMNVLYGEALSKLTKLHGRNQTPLQLFGNVESFGTILSG